MAYRELSMMDVKEVLRRWSAGHSDRRIGREAGVDRKTVARYTTAATRLGFAKGRDITEDDVHAVAQVVQARPAPTASDEWSEVARHRDRIEQWLRGDAEKRPLRLTKVHTLLVRDHDLQASYDTLRRFAMTELAWRKKAPTVRVEDPPPGQEAQVDFGEMGLMLDPETGRKRRLWVLVVTLSFSRLQFVWPTFRQTTEAVCEGLDRAWQFFGAMPASIIPDNTKAMIRRPDALDARLVDAFLDYVQARGLFVDPARVRSPKDKPRVENQVPYVRELVRRRDVHVARRCPRERRALVARGRRRARARHHEAGSSRALRGSREADDEASAGRALRRPRLDRQGEGPPGPPHPGRARALLGPDALPATARPRSRRPEHREDLLRHRAHQGAPAQTAGRPLHRRPRLPGREGSLRAPGRRRDPSQGAGQGPSRRSLRGAAPRWTAAVDEDAPGLRPARPLRQVHARPRRGDLPERARIRPR
ncbi:MAG: transposase [Polyangiaceae bacterium]|nr:transposase [Polyangiaceae bacterium]